MCFCLYVCVVYMYVCVSACDIYVHIHMHACMRVVCAMRRCIIVPLNKSRNIITECHCMASPLEMYG